ncbi:hypothetical protein [Phormidium sp. CCY1219]|uniref:hypothetical protein n=1 Tax=Phormidium sp. CCY1219 TaxID=2886104 RepID=UPI002D1F71E5|nr:hypothetical protein [Phormidium sp. CCY1219]MEB3830516.1 hypothetical protein [Phormidium sp. CCY1219]
MIDKIDKLQSARMQKILGQGKAIAGLICAILPAVIVAILIAQYSINVPFADQWFNAGVIIDKFSKSTLSFTDLIAQHNESRKFFPRLIFLAIAYLTRWDVRVEMAVSLLLAVVISATLYRLNRITVGGSLPQALFLTFIANLLIFAPIQYENWLWGIQVVVFLPIACLSACIAVAHSQLSQVAKFAISTALCTISTFSFANGMLLWIVVLPVLAFAQSPREIIQKKGLILGWLAFFAANVGVYFYRYVKPDHHPTFSYAIQHPGKTVHFFLVFLGTPLAQVNPTHSIIVATGVGLAILVMLIGVCGYLVICRDMALLDRAKGWLAIAAYSAMSGAIASVGRVGFGIDGALASRYTTFSVYLLVSLVHLMPIVCTHFNRNGAFFPRKLFTTRVVASAVTALMGLHLLTSLYAIEQMSVMRRDRLQAKACLLLSEAIDNPKCLFQQVFPVPLESFSPAKQERVKAKLDRIITRLDELGFLDVGLVKSKDIGKIAASLPAGGDYGWLDNVESVDKGVYRASGWAMLPERKESADAVILTYKDEKQRSLAFAIADVRVQRQDLDRHRQLREQGWLGWQTDFSASALPPGPLTIQAWAFDALTGNAYLLNGTGQL